MNPLVILTLFTLLLALALNFIDAGAKEENPSNQEDCMQLRNFVIGLKPFKESSEDVLEPCKQFWHCRVMVNDRDGTKNVTAKNYTCAEADPKKPYYHAETCECIESSSHCKEQQQGLDIYDCTRPVTYEDLQLENLEDCRGFGKEGKYYYEDFAHFDTASQFWKCSHWSYNTTVANSLMNCSDSNSNLIWDSTACQCNHSTGNITDDLIHKANNHPMNRFRCAKELIPDICKEDNETYYTGLFPNIGQPNSYWECVVNTTTKPKITEPLRRNCDNGLLFDIVGCNCTNRENFHEEENQDPDNYYNCANILEVDPDPETELCKDRNGVYHIGDIPNVQDCSKFYSCTENNDEKVRAVPKPRECPSNQNFNVLACQCWGPASFDCKVNEDPDNTFNCANITLSLY